MRRFMPDRKFLFRNQTIFITVCQQIATTSAYFIRNLKTQRYFSTENEGQAIVADFWRLVNKNREEFDKITNHELKEFEMEKKRFKITKESIPLIQTPTNVTLEVLSNGTTHMAPSVFIRTPLNLYLFNAPEGTSRFSSTLRLRFNKTADFFFTRATWNNIGGLAGMMLGKDVTAHDNTSKEEGPPLTRLHGPSNLKSYLENIRPFLDSDSASVKFPVVIEEWPYQKKIFEDQAIKVQYIPIQDFNSHSSSPMNSLQSTNPLIDVGFLLELKAPPKNIDVNRLIELKIPNGPLIGKLKSGQTVTLEDGRVITPEQVYASKLINDRPNLLIVEIVTLEKLNSIAKHELLKEFVANKKSRQLNYLVHFTPPEIFQSEKYALWMNSFGDECTHVVVNGTGPIVPLSERLYRAQSLHRHIFPEAFPDIYPPEFNTSVEQDEGGFKVENVIAPNSIRRFPLRGALKTLEDKIIIQLGEKEIERRISMDYDHSLRDAIENFQKESATIINSKYDPYPTITFLGTASAIPIHYRNVTAQLLHLSPTSCMMIDCGEGSYGQMKILFGPEECVRQLLNLHAVFITHAHQDHFYGLITLILKRVEAFKQAGIKYRPLVLISNQNVRNPLHFYSTTFENIEQYYLIVDISMRTMFPINYKKDNPNYKGPKHMLDQFGQPRVVIDVEQLLPKNLYSSELWNLRSVKAIHVTHTAMAAGFIFEDAANGRRIVFSGDTMPCELLVNQGHGADVLVHESTFEDSYEEDATRKRHSTMGQAVDVGKRMEAKHIFLTHFSSRYPKVPPLPDYLFEAANISLAMDNMVVRYDHLPIFHKLLTIYKKVYREELFDIEIKSGQRELAKKNFMERISEQRISPKILRGKQAGSH